MTNGNKLQNEFAKTVDRLNDAYVYCQKELNRLREDNNNLRLDVMYYKTLLKKCRKFVRDELKRQIEEVLK